MLADWSFCGQLCLGLGCLDNEDLAQSLLSLSSCATNGGLDEVLDTIPLTVQAEVSQWQWAWNLLAARLHFYALMKS